MIIMGAKDAQEELGAWQLGRLRRAIQMLRVLSSWCIAGRYWSRIVESAVYCIIWLHRLPCRMMGEVQEGRRE